METQNKETKKKTKTTEPEANIGTIKHLADQLCLTHIASGQNDVSGGDNHQLIFLENTLSKEQTLREEKNRKNYLVWARLPEGEYFLENFDLKKQPNIKKGDLQRLTGTTWLERKEKIVIRGRSNCGKTHFAVGIARALILQNKKVFYTTLDDLVRLESLQKVSEKMRRRMEYANSCDLVIVDEVGYMPMMELEADAAYRAMLNFIKRSAMIIITNKPFSQWDRIFYGNDRADILSGRITSSGIGFDFRDI